MAEQVDADTGTRLRALYARGYLMPTAFLRPTPFGLEMRLLTTENQQLIFIETPEKLAHDSLMRAHGLILFHFVNDYFKLGLDAELEPLWNTFPKIGDGALVDPDQPAELHESTSHP